MNTNNQQITEYLISKKMPLDILLEVKDHMAEQVLDIEQNQNVDFSTAFQETKKEWESDLEMRRSFFSYRFSKITRLQNRIMFRSQFRILKQSLLVLLTVFIITSFSVLFLPNIADAVFLVIYVLFAGFGLVISFTNRKLIKTTKPKYNRNISIYQKVTGNLLLIGSFYITVNNILSDTFLLKINESIKVVFIQHHITWKVVGSFMTAYIFIWIVTYGYLYLYNYKKAIKKIEERMPLSL